MCTHIPYSFVPLSVCLLVSLSFSRDIIYTKADVLGDE